MAASKSKNFSVLIRQLHKLSQKRTLESYCKSRVLFYSSKNDSSNPFYEKYSDKILQRTQNSSDHEDSMKRPTCTSTGFHKIKKKSSNIYDTLLRKEIEGVKEQTRKAAEIKEATVSSNLQNGSLSFYGEKGLDAIMHLDKIEMESAESIKEIWKEFHGNKDCVSAVLPSSMYDTIQERARTFPVFIYPVPRNDGYELMVGEFLNNQCYVTSVLNYQTLGENAPWLVAFTHFTELKESKGIVLMVGEIDTRYITSHEAMFIANLIQLYYGTDDDIKLSLLKTFNADPEKFDFMSVVKEMERSTICSV